MGTVRARKGGARREFSRRGDTRSPHSGRGPYGPSATGAHRCRSRSGVHHAPGTRSTDRHYADRTMTDSTAGGAHRRRRAPPSPRPSSAPAHPRGSRSLWAVPAAGRAPAPSRVHPISPTAGPFPRAALRRLHRAPSRNPWPGERRRAPTSSLSPQRRRRPITAPEAPPPRPSRHPTSLTAPRDPPRARGVLSLTAPPPPRVPPLGPLPCRRPGRPRPPCRGRPGGRRRGR